MSMRQADYTEANGNKVWEIKDGLDVYQTPNGSWYQATKTDESMIEAAEARELIESKERV